MDLRYIQEKEKRLRRILTFYGIVDEKVQSNFIEDFSKELLKL